MRVRFRPGAERKDNLGDGELPFELMSEEQKEEKKIRDKWGGTLAESVPISDLKMLNTKGYIPRSQVRHRTRLGGVV